MRLIRFFVLTTVIIAAVIGFANTGPVRGDELPKVLLIGDSIMQGYFAPTQTLLAGKLTAYQPIPGSGETRRALTYIDDWIAQEDWDVIHFNWGLHDVYTQSVNYPGVNSVSIAQYEQNLLALVPKLLASGAELVWCNTTPSYDSAPAFVEADILAYNAVAQTIMDANGIPTNNLHDLARPLLPGIQRAPGDIHYSVAGYQIFAEQVAASILATGVWEEQSFTGLYHSGATDPATEGWTLGIRGGGIVGPVIDDMGTGLDAWKVDDPDSATGFAGYLGHAALTAQALADIASNGWSMRANMRVDDLVASGYDETMAIAPGFQVKLADAMQWVIMVQGSDSSGNTTVQLKGGEMLTNVSDVITISGGGYHTYDLRATPAGLADLYIDGVREISNFGIATTTAPNDFIVWGSRDSAGVGAGYFNSVAFEVTYMPGDANGDGTVDEADAAILAGNWQTQKGAVWADGDFNGDGRVDDIDATLLATNWQTTAAGSASVPEPGTIALLLSAIGSVILAFYRQKGN